MCQRKYRNFLARRDASFGMQAEAGQEWTKREACGVDVACAGGLHLTPPIKRGDYSCFDR